MKVAKYVIPAVGAVALVVGQALSDRGSGAVSGSRAFSIDARRFIVQDAGDSSGSFVERELARMGIDTHDFSKRLASTPESRTVEPLREEPGGRDDSAHTGGLEPEHVLRLETPTGPVEISFGHVARGKKDFLRRLRSSGWECTETDAHGIPGTIAQLTTRKESSFVILEKTEGRFLAIRRPLR